MSFIVNITFIKQKTKILIEEGRKDVSLAKWKQNTKSDMKEFEQKIRSKIEEQISKS